MRSTTLAGRSIFDSTCVALILALLWLLMHGYHGLTGDGQIYAFQAMARLHSNLAADLYLRNTSQDRYTVFSPVYACCIWLLGLENAARSLTLLFTLWLLAALCSVARVAVGRDGAWVAVALLLISVGDYGGAGVFRIMEPFLTARLPAEALAVTALYCQIRGKKRLALTLALAALLIHPLMALPGLLLVISLCLPVRVSIIGAIAGVIATFALSVAAVELPAHAYVLTIMDASWLEVVRERSQFLFLQLWSMRDWQINAQPFVWLGFVAIAFPARRKLCASAALVGAAGLAVALISGFIGPVALLVQGQAWRWIWVTKIVSMVLLPSTALQVARNEKCGLLCAILLVLGWTLSGILGTACVVLTSLVWLARTHISTQAASYFRWASLGLAIAVGVWMLTESWAILFPPSAPSAPALLGVVQIRGILSLGIPAVLLCLVINWVLSAARSVWVSVLISAVLVVFSVLILPAAFMQPRLLAAPAESRKFEHWTTIIPPTSTVLVAPVQDVGAFVWFTLDRPNYLSLDQSAGVVFSRATALEVRRRSEMLLPLMDQDWKLLTHLRSHSVGARDNQATIHPLTLKSLSQVCADPDLGFVISPDKVEFDRVPQLDSGALHNWNLYDCGTVRSARPIT